MKAKVILATTEIDLEGDQFSEDCLKKAAAETDLPQPMFMDFKKDKRVGDVVSLRHEDGKLIGVANIPKLAVVPGYMFDPKEIEELPDGTRVIESCVILEWGLTCNPTDPNCKIIGIEEEASKIIEKQSSSASIREVQKLIEHEKKRKLIEIVGLWEGIEVYRHPMTIQITVKDNQEYSIVVKEHDKKNPLNPSRILYDCESAKSLFEKLLIILGLHHQIEVQVKVKEE